MVGRKGWKFKAKQKDKQWMFASEVLQLTTWFMVCQIEMIIRLSQKMMIQTRLREKGKKCWSNIGNSFIPLSIIIIIITDWFSSEYSYQQDLDWSMIWCDQDD